MQSTNKQDLPGLPKGLWIVATPIGNLADLSERAKLALEQADLILCEDTRRTGALLSAMGVSAPLKRLRRLDAHTSEREMDRWIDDLQQGQSLAMVTDAGTPGISDPGGKMVSLTVKKGIRLTPVPGPSAVGTLISVSGFQSPCFSFRGFFPRTVRERQQELHDLKESHIPQGVVWFESPNRIVEALEAVSQFFPESSMVVGKELTKIHERIFHGSSLEVLLQVKAEIERVDTIGEWCFALEFYPKLKSAEANLDDVWIKALRCLLKAGISVSESAKLVSHEFGTTRKAVYAKALSLAEGP